MTPASRISENTYSSSCFARCSRPVLRRVSRRRLRSSDLRRGTFYSYWTASTMLLRAAERAGRRPAKTPMRRPERRAARAGTLG
jgi:hypothetical protein